MITTEEIQPEEQAFNEAHAGFTLFGEPLRDYSASRKVAAQTMGMLYPFVGEAGAAQMASTGMYAGALKDTIILTWLCTLPDPMDLTREDVKAGVWTPARAAIKPVEALEAAMKWAEEKKMVDLQAPEFQEAFAVFMAITTGVSVAEFHLANTSSNNAPEGDNSPKV